ncbi:CRISPR-associated protein Cas4 [Chryseomicrobium imtechense]
MESKEEEYLLLSGIQHFEFCRRQWALIHIEQQWQENVKTIEGQHVHKTADQPFIREKRANKLVVRSLPVQSHTHKITGVCDVVEFVEDTNGVTIYGEKGTFSPIPIEYKRGKPKKGDEDIVQLTAQAICLEEMLACEIEKGYLFYNETKHRSEVYFTEEVRLKVKQIVREMHSYYNQKYTPKVKTGTFCKSCSLQSICLPRLMTKETVASYLERKLGE